MSWKSRIKNTIPVSILNRVLLAAPFLYRTQLVDYETNLRSLGGIDDLLSQFDLVANVPGEVIECGCSRCGTTVLLAEHLRRRGVHKKVFAYDSFEGFDRDEIRRERAAGKSIAPENAFTSTSFKYVQSKLIRLGVGDSVVPVQGYFQQTLPCVKAKFCLVFIDCDLRDSLTYCAQTLWTFLEPGGRMLFDDYISAVYFGAREGVDQFVHEHKHEIRDHGLLNRLYFTAK